MSHHTGKHHQHQWQTVNNQRGVQQRLLIQPDDHFIPHPGTHGIIHQYLVCPATGYRRERTLPAARAGRATLTGTGSYRLYPDLITRQGHYFAGFRDHDPDSSATKSSSTSTASATFRAVLGGISPTTATRNGRSETMTSRI